MRTVWKHCITRCCMERFQSNC